MCIEDYVACVPPKMRHLFPPPAQKRPKAEIYKAILEQSMQAPTTKQPPISLSIADLPSEEEVSGVNPDNAAESTTRNTSVPPQATAEPPKATAEQEKPQESAEKKNTPLRNATSLRRGNYPQHLYMLLSTYTGEIAITACMEMIDQIYQECGSPNDPLAIMLIQQVVFYHELIPIMFRKAISANQPDLAKVHLSAADKLSDNHRKAIEQLRSILGGLPKSLGPTVTQEAADEANPSSIASLRKQTNKKKSA